jgi:hypothetical protein
MIDSHNNFSDVFSTIFVSFSAKLLGFFFGSVNSTIFLKKFREILPNLLHHKIEREKTLISSGTGKTRCGTNR